MATFVCRECLKCNAKQVVPERQDKMSACPCEKCGEIGQWSDGPKEQTLRMTHVPDAGWESENRGLGHYCPQLETDTRKRSKDAFCRSRGELIEKAKRRGWEVFR